MKVVVTFGVDADIIDCPEEIIDDLIEYRDEFTTWLFDKQNNHSYWFYINGERVGCCYRSEPYVEWINTFILDNSLRKVKVLESSVKNWDKNLPSIFF